MRTPGLRVEKERSGVVQKSLAGLRWQRDRLATDCILLLSASERATAENENERTSTYCCFISVPFD